jgi:serine phosphatase RsbU (regulator of sigma subunit)
MTATTPVGSIGVLLVEDDDDDALIVEDLLADSGADVRLSRGRTLQEGLALLPGRIDCVLLDLRLPDATGLEGVMRIRDAAPWIAVIVFTGLDDEHAGQSAVEVGAQDYLIKGKVQSDMLARSIRYAVGRRQAEDVTQQLRVAEIRADENARLERGLVPRPIVNDPALWIASAYLPGRQRALLGGDFFDAVQTADGRLHVIMGDVSGRGPDEAALGAGLRIAWRALTLSGAADEAIVSTLQLMIENERRDAGAFATLCTLCIDHAARQMTVHRAGHPAPMLIDGDEVTSLPLDGGGPPIGMFDCSDWPSSRFALPERWTVLLYTDGLIEGHADGAVPLGEDGLRVLVAEHIAAAPGWRDDPHGLLDGIIASAEEINGTELEDDVAVLMIGAQRRLAPRA